MAKLAAVFWNVAAGISYRRCWMRPIRSRLIFDVPVLSTDAKLEKTHLYEANFVFMLARDPTSPKLISLAMSTYFWSCSVGFIGGFTNATPPVTAK